MIATILPAVDRPAAGAVTCASTLPTATAMPAGSPVRPAAARVSRPASAPSGRNGMGQLVVGEAGEARVERREEVPRRVMPVLENALVPGRARVPGLGPAQLPDDPVGGLDPPVGALVKLEVLLEQLKRLGELPLRGDLPPVAVDPLLAALVGGGVDPVRVRLGGVVLPQLGIGVRARGQTGSWHSGVPSASTGMQVDAVKSVAMPITRGRGRRRRRAARPGPAASAAV